MIVNEKLSLISIDQYQKLIDGSIRSLGGYWRSISALARLMEELGELGEILLDVPDESEELGGELADIFVISTCIANQYLSDLKLEYERMGFPTDINELNLINCNDSIYEKFLKMSMIAGRIARIINHYEGDKVKKPKERDRTLGSEISKLHYELIGLSNLLNINIFHYVSKVVNISSVRDKNRFKISHDPTTEASLDRFKSVINETACFFSQKAKVWGSYEWDSNISIKDNVRNTLPSLMRFTKCAEIEALDGFVIEVRDDRYANDIDGLSTVLKETFNVIAENDPTGKNCMKENIEDENWQFSFNNVRLFVTTFANFYSENNPRYSPIVGSSFIFLQPEFSFDHHRIHFGNPHRDKTKETIRKVFKRKGCIYEAELIKQPIEAYKYIKPLHMDDDPVRWWV
ncbi:YqcI/YcgG family protein [Lederbergia sp. NSJ-179]|uniref:YqcI/YcgG family protein n=1 Tax=Lederbergia sp. NSJ-179 TaxID=2931402 RepID=UPI001FD1F60A|nr:YqcI/YcgG family protein [Lederbergia sp. NSJ-179]MCJ7841654.1 YqcI/YcgG family protein [Lederbergia sp. NSJ-179]